MATAIGTLGAVDNLSVGGYDFANPQNSGLIKLVGANQSGNYSSFRLAGSSSDYQVTAGKVLYVLSVMVFAKGATSQIEYGWAASGIGIDSSSAPASPSYPAGNILAGTYQLNSSTVEDFAYPIAYEVPSAQFPFYHEANSIGATVLIFGYEK